MQHHIQVLKIQIDISNQHRWAHTKMCTDDPEAFCTSKFLNREIAKFLNCSRSIHGEFTGQARFCSPKEVSEHVDKLFMSEFMRYNSFFLYIFADYYFQLL